MASDLQSPQEEMLISSPNSAATTPPRQSIVSFLPPPPPTAPMTHQGGPQRFNTENPFQMGGPGDDGPVIGPDGFKGPKSENKKKMGWISKHQTTSEKEKEMKKNAMLGYYDHCQWPKGLVTSTGDSHGRHKGPSLSGDNCGFMSEID